MKKRNSILVWLLLLVLLVSGCRAPVATTTAEEPVAEESTEVPEVKEPTEVPAAAEPVTLALISNYGPETSKGPVLTSIIEEFMAENPDIEIDVEVEVGEDIPLAIETAFLAGEEPEVILMNYGWGGTGAWVDDGVAIPVTDLYKELGFEGKFVESAIGEFTDPVTGELEAFPLEGFNWPMWYNTEIMAEAGVEKIPETFAELKDAAQKMRDAGYQPFATSGTDWSGGDWFVMGMEAALNTQEDIGVLMEGGFSENDRAREFVEAFIDLRDSGVFADNAEGMEFAAANELFYTGQAGIMFGGSWFYGEIPEEIRDKVALGGIPTWEGSATERPYWWNQFGAKGIFISRNGAEKLDAIKKFVKFFYQPDMIGRFVQETGMVPPLKEIEVDEEKMNTLFLQSLEITPDLEAMPPAASVMPGSLVGYGGWYNVTALAYVPGVTADEILAELDAMYAQFGD